MQRLFNILWNRQGPVIPFYFEVLDFNQWLLDFSDAYYRTFMSQHLSFGRTITDESAMVINSLTQSDPFYIVSLFKSSWPDRDFATIDGVARTLTHEIKSRSGGFFTTWSEYIDQTMRKVNGEDTKISKRILLYLSRERHKECTRDEIRAHLKNAIDDRTLERKLNTMIPGI